MRQAQTFLSDGEQVQIQVFLRGRQRNHPDRAVALLWELAEEWLLEWGKLANSPNAQKLSLTVNPKKR